MSVPLRWRERLALPLIAAPMTGVSSPALVSAACRNGVIGTFPSHNATSVVELDDWLNTISADLDQQRQRSGVQSAPLGVNLVVHRSNGRLGADLECVAAHRVELVIASVGNPAVVVDSVHAAGGLVFADVATMHHVQRAIDVGVDGLVLLTAGAGGQTGWLNPFAFVRAVCERYEGPIVLAGGIADGAALWAAQTLGADLAYMGTKFIATTESAASDAYKQAVVHAGADDIELTTKYTGLPTSVIINTHNNATAGGDAPATAASFEFDLLLTPRSDVLSGGHSVVGVHDVPDVKTLIDRTTTEYSAAREHTLASSPHRPIDLAIQGRVPIVLCNTGQLQWHSLKLTRSGELDAGPGRRIGTRRTDTTGRRRPAAVRGRTRSLGRCDQQGLTARMRGLR